MHRQSTQKLKEVFSRELPSRFCRSHIKRASGVSFEDHPPTVRLASEHHCVTLSKRGGKNGDNYASSTKSLPSRSERKGSKAECKDPQYTHASKCDDNGACIAHSSLSFESNVEDCLDSIEVFAIARKYQSSALATPSKPSHVKSASEESIGSTIHDDAHKGLSYYLAVKVRYLAHPTDTEAGDGAKKSTKTALYKSFVECVDIPFRPSMVHLAELQISSVDSDEHIQGLCTSAVGIYVTSSDDNELRLYAATRSTLNAKSFDRDMKSSIFTKISIDAADQRSHKDSTHVGKDESPSEPFTFTSSITAIDTSYKKLAVALFDGTIHIILYNLIQKTSNANIQELKCQINTSTFIIDGPVSTLHFGKLCFNDSYAQPNQTFLVAGSLCGFACIFYEVSTVHPNCNALGCFEGPLPLVDELFDPIIGNEDCVTAVHACCYDDARPMIVVGTQCGRVLLFERSTHPKHAFNELAHLRNAKLKQDALVSKISGGMSEINKLHREKETFQVKLNDLEVGITGLKREIESFQSNAFSASTNVDNNDVSDCSDEEAEEFIGDIQTEFYLLSSKLQLLETELSETMKEISNKDSLVLGLQSDMQGLPTQLDDARKVSSTLPLRKIHRYQIVSQNRLPYPLQGIYFQFGEFLFITRRTLHLFRKTREAET